MDTSHRIKKLQELIKASSFDALIIDHPINIFYLTGLDLSLGRLIIAEEKCFLIVDGRYLEVSKQKFSCPVLLLKDDVLKEVFTTHLLKSEKVAFSQTNTTYFEYMQLKKILDPLEIVLEPSDDFVTKIRRLKEPSEIDKLKKAAELGSEGYDFVLKSLQEGISEEEVAAELEIFWKRNGGKGVSFEPIIAFGKGGSMPHYRPGGERLKKGDSVLIDIGVNLDHYHSDMTRVVFCGQPDPKILEIYAIVQEAHEKALAMCKPGVTVGQLDSAARDFITQKGYGDNFTHSLGHGIGLEIHESPILRNKPPMQSIVLEEGMVITIEPGIYLSDKGGVRLEDTVVITKDGFDDLTKRPKDVLVI